MRVAVDLPLENAECPVWNPVDSRLYWVDIPAGRMYRYNPEDGSFALIHEVGQQVGALVVAEDGSIIQGLEEGRIQRWKDGAVSTVCDGIAEEAGRRFNDAVVDPAGRLLIGTMPGGRRPARVYIFEPDGSHRVLLDDVGQSNGMRFSGDGRTLFHTDTTRHQVSRYRFDPESGIAEPLDVLVTIREADVVPDGLAIDSEDRLWLALWGGSAVVCYDSKGSELSRVEMPTPQVSSVCFGGDKLDVLFVTTAGGNDRSKWGPSAGALFSAITTSRGQRPVLAKSAG